MWWHYGIPEVLSPDTIFSGIVADSGSWRGNQTQLWLTCCLSAELIFVDIGSSSLGATHTLHDLAEWLHYESWCQGFDSQATGRNIKERENATNRWALQTCWEALTVRTNINGILRYGKPLLHHASMQPLRSPKESVIPMLRRTERWLLKDPKLAEAYKKEMQKLIKAGAVKEGHWGGHLYQRRMVHLTSSHQPQRK